MFPSSKVKPDDGDEDQEESINGGCKNGLQ